ncbi:MAG: hypothetical protein AWU59_843 [Methanolobus sp. T82-4]|nr:MAG: hypothetical protein AWU59_843 [Methanolobus sp. T82-4]
MQLESMTAKIEDVVPYIEKRGKPLTYQMGFREVAHYPEGVVAARKFHKFCICPGCFGTIHLGRNSDKQKWSRSYEDYISNRKSRLNCRNEDAFLDHVDNCTCFPENGVNRIDNSSSKRECNMVDLFSQLSRKGDNGYHAPDSRRVRGDDILFGNFIAYMFIDACGPTSCAMFEIWNNKKSEKRIGLIDVYTFQPFRNRGYATKILEYAIEDLNINRSSFSYLSPACDTMNHIFGKLGVNPIAFCNK